MSITEACECLYSGTPVTIRSLTNAQSYCVKDVEPYEKAFLAKFALKIMITIKYLDSLF